MDWPRKAEHGSSVLRLESEGEECRERMVVFHSLEGGLSILSREKGRIKPHQSKVLRGNQCR